MNSRAINNFRQLEDTALPDFDELCDTVGVVEAVRVYRQLCPGTGDYTAERHDWLDAFPPGHFMKELLSAEAKRNQEQP